MSAPSPARHVVEVDVQLVSLCPLADWNVPAGQARQTSSARYSPDAHTKVSKVTTVVGAEYVLILGKFDQDSDGTSTRRMPVKPNVQFYYKIEERKIRLHTYVPSASD
jgi:hypothetical protein